MELKDYLRMIRKGWYWFIVTFAAVFLVDRHLIAPREPEHIAKAEMLVRLEQYSPPELVPALRTLAGHYINLETRVTTLVKGPVFEAAADLLQEKRPYRSGKVAEKLQKESLEEIRRLEQSVLAKDPGTDFRTYLIGVLEDSIERTERDPRSKSQLVEIRARAPTATLAKALANAQAEAAFQTDEDAAVALIRKAIVEVRGKLGDAQALQESRERERQAFAREQGVYDLQTMEENLHEAIQKIEDEQADLQTVLNQDRERIRQWLEEITRERVLGVSIFAAGELESVALNALVARLADAQKELDELLQGSPEHLEESPQRKAAEAKVESLKESLRRERDQLTQGKRDEENKEIARLMSDSRLREMKIQKELEGRKTAKEEALAKLADIRLKWDKLQQDHTDARNQVKDLSRMLRELERGETEVQSPVEFYSAAQRADPVMAEGERALTRIFVLILVAIIFGLGIVYFLEYVDTRVTTTSDVKRYLDLPILGIAHKERGSACLLDLPLDHILAEKFNTAATLVRSRAAERDHKAIMVASTNEKEGKTTVALNLGLALARKGHRVILVDADLRRPSLHSLLGVENVYGVTRLVGDRTDPARILEDLAAAADLAGYEVDPYIQPTGVENLAIVPSGPLPDNPPLVLESPYMGIAVRALCDKADFVILDTPPLNAIGDALSLARHVKGCIFVVGAGRLEKHEASWARNLLKSVQADILGVLLNFAVQEPRDYYYYSHGQRRLRGRSDRA